VIDAADTAVVSAAVGTATGRKAMSAAGVGNRIGAENSEEDVAGIHENGSGDTLVRPTMQPLNGGPVPKRQPMLRPVGAPGSPSYSGCVADCAGRFGWSGVPYEKCVNDCEKRFRTRPDMKPEEWGNCQSGSYGNCWDWASNCPQPARGPGGTGHMPSGVLTAVRTAVTQSGQSGFPCITPPDCATLVQGTMGRQGLPLGATGCPYGYYNIRIIVKTTSITNLPCGPWFVRGGAWWICETLVDIHFQRGNGAGGYTECSDCSAVGTAPNPVIDNRRLTPFWLDGRGRMRQKAPCTNIPPVLFRLFPAITRRSCSSV
jgi:hypothetical protein